MPKVNFPAVFGVDWLQLFGHLHKDPATLVPSRSVKVLVADYPTPQFLSKVSIDLVKDNKLVHFAEVLFKPRHSFLPSEACQLRVLNQALYTSSWFEDLRMVSRFLGFEFFSISRIDVYCDCCRYWGGRRPAKLVLDYVQQRLLKIGINRGSASFQSYGYSVAKCNAPSMNLPIKAPDINAVTWGSKGYIQTQIYNKSLELRQVKFKPWIYDSWQRAGLVGDDVWRSEIRIQKQGKSIQLLDSGDMFALGVSDVADQQRIKDLFLAYADKHLRFVVRDYHAKKQQMKPIKLFSEAPEDERSIKPKINRSEITTNRTTKSVQAYLSTIEEWIDNGNITLSSSTYKEALFRVQALISQLAPDGYFDRPHSKISRIFQRLEACRLNSELKMFNTINI